MIFQRSKRVLIIWEEEVVLALKERLRKWDTLKKREKSYKEQDPQKVDAYLKEIEPLNKNDFVYIDESGIGKDVVEMNFWMKKGDIKKIKVDGK